MKRLARSCLLWAASFLTAWPALAHDLPVSYVDLRVTDAGIEATVESSAKNFARELSGIDEEALLLQAQREKAGLLALVASRFEIAADGEMLRAELRAIEPLPGRKDLRLHLRFPWKQPADEIKVRAELFSSEPRHKTFLNIYRGEALQSQGIFEKSAGAGTYRLSHRQGTAAIVKQFVREGVHHIFIGPDHILFIIGLLLLGGTLGQLLKIVTAFTIAHSVTLVLATLNVLSPPARLIEPMIALSIVFAGAHALLRRDEKRDWRLLFAFGFGFVHGFGFADVLGEMHLPRQALGWSLFSFNFGVEIGQACIVLAVAPVLGILARRNTPVSRGIIMAGSFCVIFAGAFWLTQRLFSEV
ncbi:MAG: HupE/UreJ family protein [Verrucomicrobiota bacterium]|nr:HupE/UreJ family protein [Verrucomicrobiota bacterium]